MKGLILSAGMGTRLVPLTHDCPKCLVRVAGKPMMEYQLDSLIRAGIDSCIIVVGYMAESVCGYFGAKYKSVSLSYVVNSLYAETNNLYSFWLAKTQLDDDVILLEGDLVFDDELVHQMVRMDDQNVALVDQYRPPMDGTVILANDGIAQSMVLKADQGPGFDFGPALKTINIYRLSREALAETILPEMEEFLAKGQATQYYEAVFAMLIETGRMSMTVMNPGTNRWAEIDTMEDLSVAEKIFARPPLRLASRGRM